MAAIYSGIHLKLKSPHTPWEDKLKLARFAWISSQCLLPNKEQVLLDWCTHALTGWHNKKVEFSQEVLEGLWCYLDDVLRTRKLHSALKQGKAICLRINMAQLLIDCLQGCANGQSQVSLSTILSVSRSIFSSPALSSVFTTKYELVVNLLAKFCLLACREIQTPSFTKVHVTASIPCQDEPTMEPPQTEAKAKEKPKKISASGNLFEVFLQALSCYLSVQRQQANPNRVFTVVTNQLLQPLVLLRYLLTAQGVTPHLRQQLRRDIRLKIDSVLQLALFSSEHLASYKAELFPPKEDSGRGGSAGIKGPLKPASSVLCKLSDQGFCEPSLHYSVKSDALPLFFKFFLERYGKGKGEGEEEQRMLCFYYLARLVPALDIHPGGRPPSPAGAEQGGAPSSGEKPPPASTCAKESWSLALQALDSLLSQALSADIYNVAADRIRHKEVQLNFYRALAQIFFNEAQPSMPAWYHCLKVLLNLNHLILEPDLDQLLSSAWVNAEDTGAQVQQARQLMVGSLLQTYTKLRQLPRLFSVLVSVICQPALDDRRPPLLTEGISASLRALLLDTPPSQVLEICSSVLQSIRTYVLPDLAREPAEADEMETDGGHEKEDASLKLSTLCQLLHVVLFSLKTLDDVSPVPLVRQSTGLMEEMQQTVKELLHLLKAERKPSEPNAGSAQKNRKKCKKNLDPEESLKASELRVETLWEQRTQDATLLLRYTWVEVDTLFHMYCSKYTGVDSSLTQTEGSSTSPLVDHTESLVSGRLSPAWLRPSPSRSPSSCLLLKLLTLHQMKKVLLDGGLRSESGTAALLQRAAQFILARSEPEAAPAGGEEPAWDTQVVGVDASTYRVAHWHLLTTNFPLILPHLSGEDVGHIAQVFVGSLLKRQAEKSPAAPPGHLTFSLISSQLARSPFLAEMPSLFSATVECLTRKVIGILGAGHKPDVCPKFLALCENGGGATASQTGQLGPASTPVNIEALVEDIVASSKSGEAQVLLTDAHVEELLNLLQVLTNLNPDGMSSEDLCSLFLLLLFTFTSTSRRAIAHSPDHGGDAGLLGKLLGVLDYLLEARSFPSVLKLIHGGTLLQAAVAGLLRRSTGARLGATGSADFLDLVRAAQGFVRSLVQLIIVRNSSVRLNLEQFSSFLISEEISGQISPSSSMTSVHLLLACLASFSQAMSSNLGKSKQMDQTLTQMLARASAGLGPGVEFVLKRQTAREAVVQPTAVLGQAFVVEVVTVMLQGELASLSVEHEGQQSGPKLALTHESLYRGFGQQILREIVSAPRPTDFVVSSLRFLSVFYAAMEGRAQGEAGEREELYIQMLQTVHRLLAAPWLSHTDVAELEPVVQELLCHLVEKCTDAQFNQLLLMVREGLDIKKLRAGNYKEVLSAAVVTKLLSCCQLPETCSKALWLIAPQIISAIVLILRSSSQDVSLTLPFTVPMVMSMTSLLRHGEGLIANPHHVIVVFGALHSLPLDHLTPPTYHAVFLAVHEALFAIIQCHPQVILKSAPSFLNVFHRLVASIMQEGRQRKDGDTGSDGDLYLQCSRLTERMYSHIAAAAESWTALWAFMVAQYVTELQKVTLRADVKQHLTEGIYYILDLCKEQDIKFLKAGLHAGVREVFNELYSSYTHYHKAQRQGEEKYTV
ncbi:unnamed protein product [Menidia menidia]|uniref:(Atlantic silverside) hypothetical protein n=1 Tax=Menidia menidia TaxID=238744 RepID=A0A8S4AEJ8_9TELE|nr:unnamed protein product [Menidia menidia]